MILLRSRREGASEAWRYRDMKAFWLGNFIKG